MLRKEIMELFKLCMEVTAKTSSFVSFNMSSHVKACDINIIDKGYSSKAKRDGRYYIYFDSELFEKSSRKKYEAAKAHLTRLLKENGS